MKTLKFKIDYFLNSVNIITGYTGSGKTTLAKYFYDTLNRCIVYKVNPDDDYQGVNIFEIYDLVHYFYINYERDKKVKIVYDDKLKDMKDFMNADFIEKAKQYGIRKKFKAQYGIIEMNK